MAFMHVVDPVLFFKIGGRKMKNPEFRNQNPE